MAAPATKRLAIVDDGTNFCMCEVTDEQWNKLSTRFGHSLRRAGRGQSSFEVFYSMCEMIGRDYVGNIDAVTVSNTEPKPEPEEKKKEEKHRSRRRRVVVEDSSDDEEDEEEDEDEDEENEEESSDEEDSSAAADFVVSDRVAQREDVGESEPDDAIDISGSRRRKTPAIKKQPKPPREPKKKSAPVTPKKLIPTSAYVSNATANNTVPHKMPFVEPSALLRELPLARDPFADE